MKLTQAEYDALAQAFTDEATARQDFQLHAWDEMQAKANKDKAFGRAQAAAKKQSEIKTAIVKRFDLKGPFSIKTDGTIVTTPVAGAIPVKI